MAQKANKVKIDIDGSLVFSREIKIDLQKLKEAQAKKGEAVTQSLLSIDTGEITAEDIQLIKKTLNKELRQIVESVKNMKKRAKEIQDILSNIP